MLTLGRKEAGELLRIILHTISHCDRETGKNALVTAKRERELARSIAAAEEQKWIGCRSRTWRSCAYVTSKPTESNSCCPGVPLNRFQMTRAHLFAPSFGWTASGFGSPETGCSRTERRNYCLESNIVSLFFPSGNHVSSLETIDQIARTMWLYYSSTIMQRKLAQWVDNWKAERGSF